MLHLLICANANRRCVFVSIFVFVFVFVFTCWYIRIWEGVKLGAIKPFCTIPSVRERAGTTKQSGR